MLYFQENMQILSWCALVFPPTYLSSQTSQLTNQPSQRQLVSLWGFLCANCAFLGKSPNGHF